MTDNMVALALAACPFTADQMDALYLEERAELADAVLVRNPPPPMLLDALADLAPERRETILGLRYMLGMTVTPEHLGLVAQLDRELLAAHAAGRLELLAIHLAHALKPERRQLAATVVELLPGWEERPAGAA